MVQNLGSPQGGQTSANPYGNIQKIGKLNNGRVVYRVVDSKGGEAGKLTVPQNSADTFERAYCDIMEAAPKIQKYVAEHSTDEDLKKRKKKSNIIIAAGAALGASIPIFLTRNSNKTWKQIVATIPGILAGIAGGFAASMYFTAPPGTMKFANASKTISKLDIQPLIEK